MRLVVVAGPPSAGKTAVVRQAIRSLQGGHRIAYLKIDVVRAFEDEELATEFGIPARKVYSGDLCPDHAGVMVMRDAIAWAGRRVPTSSWSRAPGSACAALPTRRRGSESPSSRWWRRRRRRTSRSSAWNNGAFGSTGNQPTPAYSQVDMELLALAAGIRRTCRVQDERELADAWENWGQGPNFIHVVLRPGNAAAPNIPLAPGEVRERFVRALGR